MGSFCKHDENISVTLKVNKIVIFSMTFSKTDPDWLNPDWKYKAILYVHCLTCGRMNHGNINSATLSRSTWIKRIVKMVKGAFGIETK